MTKIDPNLYLANQSRGTTGSALGKDEFLKILMAQIKNQDPLNPMEDKEFISQMATFSSLEQMMNISSVVTNLANNQSIANVIQFSNLIGKDVSYEVIDEETGQVKETKTGTVKSVLQSEGNILLELTDGSKINVGSVTKVTQEAAEEETNE
ncbi:flagellar hook assembly protein FlgD [Radiobacillus deserti]|uniref:Flagellar hook assembly protein FlgD n=1 Tax=Radiobacillus deserti TaxID=2594883 RepID=A0A516KL78_9BACI|nr:flagellar hook assembly protein FlgD [Radiobacillus deserti]